MKKRLMVIALVLAGGIWWWQTRPAAVPATTVRLSGNIEATEVEASFRIGGRVLQVLADEGDTVAAGQVIAVMDTMDLMHDAGMRAADAAASAAAQLELEHGSLPEEIAAGEAARDAARAEVTRLTSDYSRQQDLLVRDIISQREFEASEAAYRAASARQQEAEQRLALLRQGPRRERISAAQARTAQAGAALALAQTRLDFATLLSPLSGVVLARRVESGEVVNAGTAVLALADLAQVWLRGFITEPDLAKVRLGQPAQVTVDGLPGREFSGRLETIASQAEFTPKTVQTEQERVKLVYRVKITLANPDGVLKPGMPADAVLQWQ